MKTPILFFGLLVAYLSAQAQSTPEAFLSQLPTVPTVNCSTDRTEIDQFTDRIYKVKATIHEIIERIHSDVQKRQKSVGNEENLNKATEKVVSEQYGISLKELEKVGEMSDAEQEKWAQQYANQMKNQAKNNPQASIKKGDKAKRLIELASEEKLLGERITERMNRISQIFKNVDAQDTIETRKLEAKIRPLEKQLCSGIASAAEIARSNAAEKQIYDLKIKYCQKMSPLQTDAIFQYLTTLKMLFTDYRRLTEAQNEVVKLQQIGEIVPQDLYCLKAVDEYADALSNAYKYCVGKFR